MAESTYAFATVDDLEERWHDVEDVVLASALLDDAGLMLRQYVTVDPNDAQQAELLKMVSCNMVKRAMVSSSASAFGVDQTSATMGPFSQTMHFANPSGDMYISAAEKSLLHIDEGYIGSIPAKIAGYYGCIS